MISFGPLKSDADVERLLAASAAEFGAEGYQRHRRYLDWLYRGPAARGLSDCLVARRGDEIVGAMHRMILPTEGPDGAGTLGVLHNHFVDDAVRSGPGVLLLRRATKDVGIAFAPGVQAPLDEIYRRLGFESVPGFWLAKPLAPVRAGIQLLRARMGRGRALRVGLARLQRRYPALTITPEPDAADVERLCAAMRAGAQGRVAVAWTPELVRWRYFDPLGPRHLIVRRGPDGPFAVLAPGTRRGVGTARLMELSDPADARFLAEVQGVMRAVGAAVALCFTIDPAMVASLTRRGWRVRGNGTWSFTTPGPAPFLTAAASDVGFEALNTEFG